MVMVVTGLSKHMKLPTENQLRTKLPDLYNSLEPVTAGSIDPTEEVRQATMAMVVSASPNTLVRTGIRTHSDTM